MRPIDADALLNEMSKCGMDEWVSFWHKGYIQTFISNAPTADAVPVVRGEWVVDCLGITVCSNCKKPRRDNRVGHVNYCNSCGSDMRGEENE